MDNKTKITIASSALIAFLVLAYFYLLKNQSNQIHIEDENEEGEMFRINSLIDGNESFTNEMKKKTKHLISKFTHINPDIAQKLVESIQLFQIKPSNAVEDMVVIIENLLDKLYSKNTEFKKWVSSTKDTRNNNEGRLRYCWKIDKYINQEDYHFYMGAISIRNREDHELNVDLDELTNFSGLASGIDAITKIGSIVYPDSSLSNPA